MKPWVRHSLHGARWCGDCTLMLACWALWLALAALAAAQLAIAVSHELAVPGFLLRSFERRLADSSLNVTFGRATFDPSGAVLIENVRVLLPGFEEPIATSRAVLIDLNPWAALAGDFDPARLNATGVTLFVPAMLSPSGRSEEMLSDLDLTVEPAGAELHIEHLTAHLAGIPVSLHGAVQLPARATGSAAPLPLADLLGEHYPTLCRRVLAIAEKLSGLEAPQVSARLTPAPTRLALVDLSVQARRFALPGPAALALDRVRTTVRLPLLDETAMQFPFVVQAESLSAASGLVARQVTARGRVLVGAGHSSFDLRELTLTASDLSARGFTLRAPVLELRPEDLPRLSGRLLARLADEPIAVQATIDRIAGTVAAHVEGALSPALLAPLRELLGHDIRRFINFGQPVRLDAAVEFSAGWKFSRLTGRIAAWDIDGYHVPFTHVAGEIDLTPQRFVGRHLYGVIGANFAHGSYEHDFATRDFRFLLEGQLRPLEIGGWFGAWWPNFFQHLAFPEEAPQATVDVSGRWGQSRGTGVFVYATAKRAGWRGVNFDYVRTQLWIRPNFIDGLELVGLLGASELRGTFTRHYDPDANAWREMEFDFASTLDLPTGVKLLGPELGAQLAPFAFERAPALQLAGRVTGPAHPVGEHQDLRILAQSVGGFALYGFPLANVAFAAAVHDREIVVENFSARAGEGELTGRARLWDAPEHRRLGFDATLQGANLGAVAATLEAFAARRHGAVAPAGAGKVLPGQSRAKLDVNLSAEGVADDFYSYRGTGNALLAGPDLGEVRLLGLLSQLLNFTSLRFTSARTSFRVEGPKVVFPRVDIIGSNSAIVAHGDYALDRGALDFNARVYPFQESKNLLQSLVGTVLTPLSAVLEVKLTGALDQPAWAFVMGPTNFLRSLTSSATPAAGTSSPSPVPPAPPVPNKP